MKSKKPYIITAALAAYMIVMAIYNIDTVTIHKDYLRYFGTLGAEAVILCILFLVLRKREQLKEERKADLIKAQEERRKLEQKQALASTETEQDKANTDPKAIENSHTSQKQ